MTGGADLHIGNAAHLRHWSLTSTGDACPSAMKMLLSGLQPPGQCRHRRSSAGIMMPSIWRKSSRRGSARLAHDEGNAEIPIALAALPQRNIPRVLSLEDFQRRPGDSWPTPAIGRHRKPFTRAVSAGSRHERPLAHHSSRLPEQ